MALFSLQDLETYCTVFYPLFFLIVIERRWGGEEGEREIPIT